MTTKTRRVTFDPSTLPGKKPSINSEAYSIQAASLRGDSYVDKLLKLMGKGPGINPYVIDGNILTFAENIFLFEVQLLDGQLMGLDTVRRSGFCYLIDTENRKRLGAIIDADELSFHLKVVVKFMHYDPMVTVHINIPYAETFFSCSFDAETGNEVALDSFRILELRGLDIEVVGIGFSTWCLNTLIRYSKFLFEGCMKDFIEKNVRRYLSELFPTLQFIVEDAFKKDSMNKMKFKPATPEKFSLKEIGRWLNEKNTISKKKQVPESGAIRREKKSEIDTKSEVSDEKDLCKTNEQISKDQTNGITKNGAVKS